MALTLEQQKAIAITKAKMSLASQDDNKKERTLGDKTLNTFREGLQGLTLGGSDEAGAAVAALMAHVTHGAPLKETYADMLNNIQQEQSDFREDHAGLALAGQLAGGLATGGAGLSKTLAATAGKSKAAQAIAAGVTGAAEGGAAGFLGSDEDRGQGAAVGAAAGAVLNPVAGAATTFFKNRSEVKKAAEEVLKRRAAGDIGAVGDTAATGFKLSDKGKAVPDVIQKQAVKQGFDEGTVSLVSGSSKQDKIKMLQMLNITKTGRTNKRFAALNRTDDVIGKSIKSRLDVVIRANKKAGIDINKAAKQLQGEPMNFEQPVQQFVADLEEIGVSLVQKGGKVKPDFNNSLIEFNGASKKALTNVVKRMQSVDVDAKQGHELKRLIDDMVTYGKVKTGLAGRGEAVLKNLRRNIDQSLDDQFPGYKAANDLYAKTITTIDDIKSAAGSKIDITGEDASKGLGSLSRTLLSNNRGRQELIKSLDQLDVMANDLAQSTGKTFNDDLVNQVIFAEELKTRFGAEARTSLGGETEKSFKEGLKAAVGDTSEIVTAGVNKAAKSLTGVNDEAAMLAMEKLLKEALK